MRYLITKKKEIMKNKMNYLLLFKEMTVWREMINSLVLMGGRLDKKISNINLSPTTMETTKITK